MDFYKKIKKKTTNFKCFQTIVTFSFESQAIQFESDESPLSEEALSQVKLSIRETLLDVKFGKKPFMKLYLN